MIELKKEIEDLRAAAGGAVGRGATFYFTLDGKESA
jgi:hypothetical protein